MKIRALGVREKVGRKGGLILNPSDWREPNETRSGFATPDGTDAVSDVKLKHAAETRRRFDNGPQTPMPFYLRSIS